MFGRKQETNPDKFWTEYEAKIGEKVLARSLGRYVGGWKEYEEPLWGLLIATSGGFRFHHFPHEGWLMALSRITSGGDPPQEKTVFIPRERLASVELKIEKRWWKKIFAPVTPTLIVRYFDLDGAERELFAETELNAKEVLRSLESLLQTGTGETAQAEA
ncbi:MAG: hypothetical protein LBB82_06370 [Treponema sp.]|jgi:hypothetical protein|nr:hypothetical protein [Treponema sp.]